MIFRIFQNWYYIAPCVCQNHIFLYKPSWVYSNLVSVCLCMCACTYMYTYACMWAWVHMFILGCEDQRTTSCPQTLFTFFKDTASHWPRTCQVSYAGWVVCWEVHLSFLLQCRPVKHASPCSALLGREEYMCFVWEPEVILERCPPCLVR